jgi:hypothetical protein
MPRGDTGGQQQPCSGARRSGSTTPLVERSWPGPRFRPTGRRPRGMPAEPFGGSRSGQRGGAHIISLTAGDRGFRRAGSTAITFLSGWAERWGDRGNGSMISRPGIDGLGCADGIGVLAPRARTLSSPRAVALTHVNNLGALYRFQSPTQKDDRPIGRRHSRDEGEKATRVAEPKRPDMRSPVIVRPRARGT